MRVIDFVGVGESSLSFGCVVVVAVVRLTFVVGSVVTVERASARVEGVSVGVRNELRRGKFG